MIFDMHCHIQPGFKLGDKPADAETLIANMDAVGIDLAIVSTIADGGISVENDITRAASERFPGRIYGYINLNLADVPASLTELERCAAIDCFRGVKLHPSNHVYYPFLEDYFGVYERIEQLGLPILWHSGTYPTSDPLQIAFVAHKFPKLRCILAHFGLLDLARECLPSAALSPNVYVDTSINAMLSVMEEWVDRFGAERLLWGSDFPLYNLAYEREKMEYLRFTPEQKQMILGDNARRLFNI